MDTPETKGTERDRLGELQERVAAIEQTLADDIVPALNGVLDALQTAHRVVERQNELLITRELHIIDADGRTTLALIGRTKSGSGGIVVENREGQVVATMGANEAGGLFSIADPAGRIVGGLQVRDGAGRFFSQPEDDHVFEVGL